VSITLRSAAALVAALVLSALPRAASQSLPFTATEDLAPGIKYYKLDARDHLGPGAHISARFLEITQRAARLDLELGKEGVQGRDTVPSMAARRGAIAAVNAGFFGTTGDPAGIFKINGLVVSDTTRPRGAVGFARPEGPPLLFDRVTVRADLRVRGVTIPVAGVDTARGARGVYLYTPRYGSDTRTKPDGSEWALSGNPLRITAARGSGPLAIPANGFVISVAGTVPAALDKLQPRDRVEVRFSYATTMGTSSSHWKQADDIVGGAGMLISRGKDVRDWTVERLDVKGFVEARHPRTLIGRDREGDIWLVVIDGRQPDHSVGMSLPELIALGRRLGLVDALNLDGGGSSTMVVKGAIVNKPSDATGPRPVSDAIVVLRPQG
jgi:hypothetical protein